MSAKQLSESTLNIRKVVRKEDVANKSLTKSIIEAIQCLINADSSNTEHVLLNIIISVTGVETEEEQTNNVSKKKSKKRTIVECEESVGKIQKLTENSTEQKVVSEKRANKTKKSTKKRPPSETDVQTTESVENCTPNEKSKKTNRWDVQTINSKPDSSKNSDDETRTSKNVSKRTNSESEQEPAKKFKSSEKSEKTTTKKIPAENIEQEQGSPRKSTSSEKSKQITTKNIPVEDICRRTECKQDSANKSTSSEKSEKTTTRNIPVENIYRSTEQEQESVNKSTSSEKSEKITTKNIPVDRIKINTSKSGNNEAETSKKTSIELKRINYLVPQQSETDKYCFNVLQNLEEALYRRIRYRWESEIIISEKFESLKLRKRNRKTNMNFI